MTTDSYELVQKWDLEGKDPFGGKTYNLIFEAIEFFNKQHYHQYVPCLCSEYHDFFIRLEKWLDNVTDEDEKRILFELVPKIIFFGRDEFVKLHETAFRGPITRWLIDELKLNFDDPDFDKKINKELHEHTWYCSITDSMQLSDFYHVNQIGGVEYRSDFRTLTHFIGNDVNGKNKISEFMKNNKKPLKRIVLLEDFVGTGTQITDAASFAAGLSSDISVLLVPLIVCPAGVKTAKDIENSLSNVKFEPVIELKEELFVNPTSKLRVGSFKYALKGLLEGTYNLVLGDNSLYPRPYSKFGFLDTGAYVVMYSNTPANTLPIIQHQSDTWEPLFPRSARIK